MPWLGRKGQALIAYTQEGIKVSSVCVLFFITSPCCQGLFWVFPPLTPVSDTSFQLIMSFHSSHWSIAATSRSVSPACFLYLQSAKTDQAVSKVTQYSGTEWKDIWWAVHRTRLPTDKMRAQMYGPWQIQLTSRSRRVCFLTKPSPTSDLLACPSATKSASSLVEHQLTNTGPVAPSRGAIQPRELRWPFLCNLLQQLADTFITRLGKVQDLAQSPFPCQCNSEISLQWLRSNSWQVLKLECL